MLMERRWLWAAGGAMLALAVLAATDRLTQSRAPVPLVAQFATRPPGAALPSDAACAAQVRRTAWEPRPANAPANRTVAHAGRDYRLDVPWGHQFTGMDDRADAFRQRISGNFTGTTDEIIQWGACKWGVAEDLVRAMAYAESSWQQGYLGDFGGEPCAPGHPRGADGRPGRCPHSFGLLQVRRQAHWGETWPASEASTAFNVDFALAIWRTCFEGWEGWLNDVARGREYAAGDAWGCVGRWYAGAWYTQPALDYITAVQAHHANRVWAQLDY